MALGGKSVALKRRLKMRGADPPERRDARGRSQRGLGVSAVTIRSDLSYLEDQGLVFRSFGKAGSPRTGRLRRRRPPKS